jgi:prepilin-type N-terminal cleavage/methylation domain-containing protein
MKYTSKQAFSLIELSIVILIIGIIIAGVTQSSELLAKSRLTAAQTLTRSSSVSGIEDLVLWLEPTLPESFGSNSLPEDSSAVANWYDVNPQSSIKNNAEQTNSSRQPIFISKCINDLPCVRFGVGGNNDVLTSPLKNEPAPNLTIFMVFESTSSAGARYCFTNGGYMFMYLSSNSIQLSFDGTVRSFNDTITPDTSQIFTILIRSGINDGSNLFINGSSDAVFTNSDNTGIDRGFSIGARTSGLPLGFVGNISELIIFHRALKTEERQEVEDYLGKKWAINVTR